jgi:hypothetical protein
MAHAAGTPPHREDECSDCDCRWHGARDRSIGSSRSHLVTAGLRDDRPDGNRLSADLTMQVARADAALRRDCLPFVLQSGRSLHIVAEEAAGWVVAELIFDPDACIFIEQSRAQFQWPREAFGRLLSKVYLTSDMEDGSIDRVTDDFQSWLALQFAA